MEKKFRKGEIVWAKVRGFPWWPAMVKGVNTTIRRQEEEGTETESKEITVLAYFIGDDSHADLPINKIEKFTSKLDEFSKTKKRTLISSIQIAKKILEGEIPFEKHLLFSKKRSSSNLKKEVPEGELPSEKTPEASKETSGTETLKKKEGDGDEDRAKKFLGKKIRRNNTNSSVNKTHHQIDLRVKEDLNKNIKINININVNNNTNNTLNITTIGAKKIVDETGEDSNAVNPVNKQKESTFSLQNEAEAAINTTINENLFNKNINDQDSSCTSSDNSSESGSECESDISSEEILLSSKEELQEAVRSLLFYKIEMPAASSTRSIINSLELIDSKLNTLKNCNIYILIKDLIPILNSFVYNKNPIIATKSSELISVIKEKVLSEIFDFENEKEEMDKLLSAHVADLERGDQLKNFKDTFMKALERLKSLSCATSNSRSKSKLKSNSNFPRRKSRLHKEKNESIIKSMANDKEILFLNRIRRNTRKRAVSNFDEGKQFANLFSKANSNANANSNSNNIIKEEEKVNINLTKCEPSLKLEKNASNNSANKESKNNTTNKNNKNVEKTATTTATTATANATTSLIQQIKQTIINHNMTENNFESSSNFTSDKNVYLTGGCIFIKPESSETQAHSNTTHTNTNLSTKPHTTKANLHRKSIDKIHKTHTISQVNLSAFNRKKLGPIDSYQMKLLFKDFLHNEERENSTSDFKEQLNNGIYSENFYQCVYNKYNGLSETLAHKRKHVCLKLLNILKLILPDVNTETLKKTIIYIEYKIRTKDPTLGNIYKKKLENFYDRLKEILSLTQESINKNIKVKNIQ